jgi:hypothetical protein
VSHPEKLLKPKGYLIQIVASVGKGYQPRVTKGNVKVPTEELVEDYSYVRHSPAYKLVRFGSLHLCEIFSSLQA